MSKTLGESFNVDSEQEMYFTEKKPQTNMECAAEERIYKIIKYQLYILVTIWKYEATVLHFLPWFSIGMCECVCVCVSLFHFSFLLYMGLNVSCFTWFPGSEWDGVIEIEWKWAEIWKRYFSWC